MSGMSEPRLLIASHIVPWNQDKANRLNPGNGLCLSALHDRAFDQHLISLTDDLTILVGDAIKRRRDEPMMQSVFLALEGKHIALPEKFMPEKILITQHRLAFELAQWWYKKTEILCSDSTRKISLTRYLSLLKVDAQCPMWLLRWIIEGRMGIAKVILNYVSKNLQNPDQPVQYDDLRVLSSEPYRCLLIAQSEWKSFGAV